MRGETFLVWLYSRLLKLYPTEFYSVFAEEMLTTFRLRLHESAGGRLWIILHEFGGLLPAAAAEHRRSSHAHRPPSRLMIAALALPVLLACVALLFRSISIFYSPGITWVLLGLVSAVLTLLGLALGRRWLMLALPSLGFMLSVGVRLFFQPVTAPGYGWSLEVRYGLPFALLTVVVIGCAVRLHSARADVRRWAVYLGGVLVIALITALLVLTVQGVKAETLSLRQFYADYVRGSLLLPGDLALAALIGLPFAYRVGSKAVLLPVGFLFSEMSGLSATLWTESYQRLAAAVFAIMFLAVIPLLILASQSQRHEQRAAFRGIAASYGVFFLLKLAAGVWFFPSGSPQIVDPVFWLYRMSDLAQILLLLAICFSLYRLVERRPLGLPVDASKPTEQSAS
ncbi:MAG: hypothetical protein IAE80_10500 [Anaerolinea sp.]|nr:hypothetical protein [Anaerolinea sp.]